ncbi:MAG: 23S rRNA (adenine(2503)-C(2))-methyltransferase RlmN [Candidatus Omnitrophica bacterium]|nr:23S rRNA (adenine(2503)-C(2))-methyltransferase RlmN [Candidatus Omnitrophota bacterium]
MKDIKDYCLGELKNLLEKENYPGFCAQQIFGWIYKKRVKDFNSMANIPKELKNFLRENFYLSSIALLKKEKSQDSTEKFLFKLKDGLAIETVLIPQGLRSTLCVSTQVGCKFKCTFCASGKKGLKRNLTSSEIINQYLNISGPASINKVTNIVFMGIGEPLDNFENTIKSIKILTDSAGIGFPERRISISTCGLVPQIEELARLNLGIKLSISLHSADDAARSKLMPVNKQYPLKELIPAVRRFSRAMKYPVTFEYALIGDINTKKSDAEKLANLMKTIKGKVNLIPYNGISHKFKPPTQQAIESFKEELKKRGVLFTSRKSRGQDINAACGQLMIKL